jgi:hypothetical protein
VGKGMGFKHATTKMSIKNDEPKTALARIMDEELDFGLEERKSESEEDDYMKQINKI